MSYSQNEILLLDKEWSSVHDNIDQCYNHKTELKEANSKEYILYGAIYIKY